MRRPAFRLFNLLFKGPPPTSAPVVLNRRQVFILPTKMGILFALFLLVMLLGAINYENNLIFLVTFLLGSSGVISILHTYRNLLGLEILPGHTSPVFAGEPARFEIRIHNPDNRPRKALELVREKEVQDMVDVHATETGTGVVSLGTTERGSLPLGRLVIRTRYPFGLFRAWSLLHPDMECIVYPAPEQGDVGLPPEQEVEEERSEMVAGGPGVDEFHSVRGYRAGDSFRRVVWKALSRGQELMTKEFTGNSGRILMLEYQKTKGRDVEKRLSRMTRLVLEANAKQYVYGLTLPGLTIEPDNGEAHMRRCLTALAQF